MDIASVGTSATTSRIAAHSPEVAARAARSSDSAHRRGANVQDVVEVSPQARKAAADTRNDLVDRVKLQIQSGTYENLKKLDTAIDRMMADLAD